LSRLPPFDSPGQFFEPPSFVTGNMPEDVAAADFNGDGRPDLVTVNYQDSTVSILLGNGDSTFQTHVDYATGMNPTSVAVADFNNDHVPDLVVTDYATNQISILLGNGDGTFQPHMEYATETGPISVTAADFNHDGNQDLAVAAYNDNRVSVLLGNGDGTFQRHSDYVTGDESYAVAAGDFNGDGNPDLAVANIGESDVSILIGNGDGTFLPRVNYATSYGPSSVAIGDFNHDGHPDLAITGCGPCRYPGEASAVGILLGKGDGTFQKQVTYAAGYAPAAVSISDFNGDGILDLAVTNEFGNNVSIYLGNGDGTFQWNANNFYGAGVYPGALAVADFNGDGFADVVTANTGYAPSAVGDTVSILNGNGDGTLASRLDYGVGVQPESVAVGDFNGDGNSDLAVVNLCGAASCSGDQAGTVSILLNNGSGGFLPQRQYTVGYQALDIAVGDFNKDGNLDLAVTARCGTDPTCRSTHGGISILLGNGDGTFQPVTNIAIGAHPNAIVSGDFNSDGNLDLAITASGAGTTYLGVLLGNGTGGFSLPVNTSVHGGPSIVAADFNGDGKLDVAIPNQSANQVGVFLGNGNGTFHTVVNYATGTAPVGVGVADFNGDGKKDLSVVNMCGSSPNCNTPVAGSVSILLGNGDGTFQPRVDTPTGLTAVSMAVADFNGDGIPDVVTGKQAGPPLNLLLGNGDGTLQAPQGIVAGGYTFIAVGILNANTPGSVDLITTNGPYGGDISVLLNNADDTRATEVSLISSPDPSTIGQAVTFTSTVTPVIVGQPTPTGTVTFASGPKMISEELVDGVATVTVTINKMGKFTVTASYSGDNNYDPNVSQPIVQTVNR
jgi:hypothetical protein